MGRCREIVIPAIILMLLFVVTTLTRSSLSAADEEDPLVIDVVGNQWWWEVRYPDLDIVTANEMHIPVDNLLSYAWRRVMSSTALGLQHCMASAT